MAAKNSREVTDLNEDVEIIRDILFGKNLQQIGQQLNALEETVASLQKVFEKELNTLREQVASENKAHKDFQQHLDQEVKNLDKQLVQQQKSLDRLKKDSAKKFKQVQGEIAAQQAHQNNLIGALANALASQQQEEPAPKTNAD